MERAKQLLLLEYLPIGEVASILGYSSINAFSRVFSRHVGVSPSRYRSG